jgi:hypothetical protein
MLVPQAPPGNERGEALPPDKISGRAAEMPLRGRTWEQVNNSTSSGMTELTNQSLIFEF